MGKSPNPLDPCRFRIEDVTVTRVWEHDHELRIVLTLRYHPWEAGPAQDILWEQANALTALRAALARGGIHDQD